MAVITLITMMIARGDARRLETGAPEPIAAAPGAPHMTGMEGETRRRRPRKPHPLLRQFFFLLGILLIIGSPLVGAIPGPGGVERPFADLLKELEQALGKLGRKAGAAR